MQNPSPLTPGSTFGDYKVVRLLGKGGMGEVWLLEDETGRQIAAKILDPAQAANHESRRRFLREAQLALGVKHPHLVETYDVGEDPETGLCYILMEYVSGGTLADYLETGGAFAIEDAVRVVEAIASVLELGRQKGIVHRDIKPANIMFDEEGTPKLSDLGIARGGAVGENETTVTRTGMLMGTPAYMSPEQMLDAHNVDTRADIYSLGVVFFEMLTGERPNKDDTIVQLMAKAVKGEPLPDVRTIRPEVSAPLAQLLSMMVAPDKEGRVSTPGQIINALALIRRGHEFANALTVSRPAKDVRPPRSGPDFIAMARWLIPAVMLGVLVGALFWRTSDRPAEPAPMPAPAPKPIPAPQPAPIPVEKPVVREVVREVVKTNIVARVVETTNVVSEVLPVVEKPRPLPKKEIPKPAPLPKAKTVEPRKIVPAAATPAVKKAPAKGKGAKSAFGPSLKQVLAYAHRCQFNDDDFTRKWFDYMSTEQEWCYPDTITPIRNWKSYFNLCCSRRETFERLFSSDGKSDVRKLRGFQLR